MSKPQKEYIYILECIKILCQLCSASDQATTDFQSLAIKSFKGGTRVIFWDLTFVETSALFTLVSFHFKMLNFCYSYTNVGTECDTERC